MSRNLTVVFLLVFSVLIPYNTIIAQGSYETKFKCIVLGAGGGIEDDNLSCYLLTYKNSSDFICLDAGSLYSGIEKADAKGSFDDTEVPENSGLSKSAYVLQNQIKVYLISHAHLDHISGLIEASPSDATKTIYGSSRTIKFLTEDIFNWQIWPNFLNEGIGPQLKKFHCQVVEPEEKFAISNPAFNVEAFTVSHQEPYQSTAYLIEHDDAFVLYLADTGADTIEKTNRLRVIWENLKPLIKERKLQAVFMECSYPDPHKDSELFGHLSPVRMISELTNLAKICDETNFRRSLQGLKVIVTGIKPNIKSGETSAEMIKRQLSGLNDLGIDFIIPFQGESIEF